MRSELSGACENTGDGATFSETKPGAGFQAGQVRGRFPPHTAPWRPPWPRLLRGPRSHTWPASSGPESHRPGRQRFPTARAQVWREGSRRPHSGPWWGSRTSGSRRAFPKLRPYTQWLAIHGPSRPGRKVKGEDEGTGFRTL